MVFDNFNSEINDEEMKAKFETERKSQDAELQKIIGAEKFQKLQAKRAERFEKMKKDLRNWEENVVPEYENDYRKRINY